MGARDLDMQSSSLARLMKMDFQVSREENEDVRARSQLAEGRISIFLSEGRRTNLCRLGQLVALVNALRPHRAGHGSIAKKNIAIFHLSYLVRKQTSSSYER